MLHILKKVKKESPIVLSHKILFKIIAKYEKIVDKLFGTIPKQITPVFYGFPQIQLSLKEDNADDLSDILSGRYYWLGLEGAVMEPMDCNKDIRVHFEWPQKYFQDIETVNLTNPADVKVPWEYSRLQHLSRLAISYVNNENEELISYIINCIKDWKDNNPYKKSVNWTCSMEVAIRAVNLIFIALIVPNNVFFSDKSFYDDFVNLVFRHGEFIIRNLETYDEHRNNHYLCDLLGLQWISLYCKERIDFSAKKKLESWYSFSRKEIVKECRLQIFPDGTDYESSIAYHRFVTELLALSVYIDKVYEKSPSINVINTVNKMATFLNQIRKPDGKLPMVGDSDDGRILIFDQYSHWDKHSCDFLLERINQYLEGDLNYRIESIFKPSNNSVCFKDSGYYILRNKSVYSFVHCGPLSLHGHGGHSHNDQLAVILCFNSLSFIVDSGTGAYSGNPELRNYFRSTNAHSTLEVIGIEQNELIKENLFMMRERTFSRCLEYSNNVFSGKHSGFEKVGIIHKRNMRMINSGIEIEDYVDGDHIEASQKWRVNYILDSDVIPSQIDEKSISMKKNDVVVVLRSSVPIAIFSTIISKEYGKTEETFRISTLSTRDKCIRTEFVLGGI